MLRERTARGAAGPFFWTPTIEGLFNYEYVRDNPEKLDDPAWHVGLPDSIVADIRVSLAHPDQLVGDQVTVVREQPDHVAHLLDRTAPHVHQSGATHEDS